MTEGNYKRDIEETDEELENLEGDPVNFWEMKQRELVTSTLDYNLRTIFDLIQSKTIDLSPEYQRRFRWDETRQSRLIESFLMNVPVPPIFLNEDKYGQYSVIDGKQRLQAIYEFFRGKLVLKNLYIFSDINGMTFDELPRPLQTVIGTRPTLRAVIILRQSDVDVKFEVFQRLNTGGVQLNPQEIRNSTYPGALNSMILDLSVNRKFHTLLGIKNKERSAIYQEMRDAELVLRYLTFRDTWETFSGGMKRSMDHFMALHSHTSKSEIDSMKKDFLDTLDVVEACFDNHAFQRWIPERKQWRQQVVAAIYDAEMFAARGLPVAKVLSKREKIITKLEGLFTDDEFRRAIEAQTNTPSYFRTRVRKMKALLENALED